LHDDIEWSYASMWVEEVIEVTDSVRAGEPIVYKLRSSFPNTCWEYGYMNVEADDDDIHVWFIQKKDMSQNGCYMTVVSYEINESIPHMPPGQYNFHFRQYGGQSIDTVVTVY